MKKQLHISLPFVVHIIEVLFLFNHSAKNFQSSIKHTTHKPAQALRSLYFLLSLQSRKTDKTNINTTAAMYE